MKPIVRWIRNGLVTLVALLVVALLVNYLLAERIIRRKYTEPLQSIAVPGDSVSIAEGKRLAQIRGCVGGCHGSNIEGEVFVDELLLARLVAPNLTLKVREYSDPELARVIRTGVRRDGQSVLGMPSAMFSLLTDEDLGQILAYLRSVPETDGPSGGRRIGPLGRLGLNVGQFTPEAELVRRNRIGAGGLIIPTDSTRTGAYLARTSCTECHGPELRGDQTTPDLRIVAGYQPEQFVHLMRTGKALGDREVRLMSQVARSRFSHFTDDEVRQLYQYLKARAAAPVPP